MCGAALAHPPVATKPAEKPVSGNGGNGHAPAENVHGPSFLGLAEDPKVEFHYLYEDEQPRSHVGLIVFLLIIVAAGGALGWQWRHNGFPFNRLNAGASGQSASPSPSEVAPAQSQDQSTHVDKPMTGAGDVLPTQSDQNQKQPDTGKTTEVPIENGQAGTPTSTGETSASNSAGGAATAKGTTAGSKGTTAGSEKTSDNNAAEQTSDQAEEAKATPPGEVPAKPRTAKARTPKPSAASTANAAAGSAPGSVDADLELAGERYLYGNGLPQNCARAESNLRTAATKGNTKAQTVLGTMYATGHCVGRDLPTAYRWFARALHQEPQNGRISADLQVLWRQMSPQEKQLATTGAQ
jgi:hypothetical protein